MALSLVTPLHPPSPPRSSRRSPFSISFLPLTPIASIPSTPDAFTSEACPQLRPTTPDSISGSTTSVSVYSTPPSAPRSPSVLPAWRAVPPTPPPFLPLSPPSHPPVRRRTHPRPASAIFSGPRTAAAQRRLSLPQVRAMRTTDTSIPPSAFRIHRRRSSLESTARRLFHIEDDDAPSDDGDDPLTPPDRVGHVPVEDEFTPKRSSIERQHALLELLVSERNYLTDLRMLVNIYLEQLPMLVSPKALTLPLLSPSYSSTFAFGRPEEVLKDKDKERDKDREKRALISDTEVNAIRRNVTQLLELHETLSSMLSDAVRASGWTPGLNALEGSGELGSEPPRADTDADTDTERCFESALRSVASLFTTQAAAFNVYEAFCAEHPVAIEIVKSLQRKRPVEWDAFERRCIELVAASLVRAGDLQERDGAGDEEDEPSLRDRCPDVDTNTQDEELPHGQRPTTSLDYSQPPLWGRSRSNHDMKRASVNTSKDTKERDPRLRLQFEDYLIKPVQRICKYPLLLGTLTLELRSQAFNGHDAVIMGAKQAMSDAAALVDSANFSHSQLQQTSRIGARLSASSTVLAFIRTLSPCALAGSLDVVRAPVLKAKYLAAFLYEGGFLALAKVTRGPRYELRYWFSLEGFELSDAADENPLLPYSFRLRNQCHEFEMAASCQREKQVWMDALRGCLSTTPAWPPGTAPSNLEPPSTAVEAHSPVDEVPSLPTIQSIPELEASHKHGTPSSPLQRHKSAPRSEFPRSRGLSEPPPNRRESAASLKSIFGPVIDPDAVTVIRASPQARSVVDALLEDVFSTACHSARSYAEAHSETLFHVSPKFGAAAKSRLSQRESVLVRRRRSYVEFTQTVKSTRKAQLCKVPPTLALDCITSIEQVSPSPDCLFDSPTVVSQCSSATGSRDGSNASPLADVLELPSSLPDACSLSPSSSDPKSVMTKPEELLAVREVPPKRSRSLVENFRGFILPHSNPPVRTLSVSRLSVFPASTPSSTSTPSSPSQRRHFWRDSIRRRSRSSPFVSADILDPASAAAFAHHRAERGSLATSWIDEPAASDDSALSPHPTPPPTPRRTLFGSSAPRGSPTTTRNMLRSIFESFSRTPSSASVAPDP